MSFKFYAEKNRNIPFERPSAEAFSFLDRAKRKQVLVRSFGFTKTLKSLMGANKKAGLWERQWIYYCTFAVQKEQRYA